MWLTMFDINRELLIYLVEQRPLLWDKTLHVAKNKIRIQEAWEEVCEGVKRDYTTMRGAEKYLFRKEVTKVWKNLRDSYIKQCRKLQTTNDGEPTKRTYIYFKHLKFLWNQVGDLRSQSRANSEDNKADPTGTKKDPEKNKIPRLNLNPDEELQEVNLKIPREVATTNVEDEKRATTSAGIVPANLRVVTGVEGARRGDNRKHRPKRSLELDEVEKQLLHALQKEKPNRHMSFFEGIVPSLEDFNEDETLHFQMGVLQLIKTIKERKTLSLTRQTFPNETINSANEPLSESYQSHQTSERQLTPSPTIQTSFKQSPLSTNSSSMESLEYE